MNGYRFHRTVLPVVLELQPSNSGVHPVPRALSGDLSVDIHPEDDHVLVGADWFPVDASGLGAIREWISGNAPVGLAEYVNLYRGLRPAFDIVDQLSDRDVAELVGPPASTAHGLVATLYEYQRTGLAWLRAHAEVGIGGILADEMGLGKTLQALGLLVHESRSSRRPSLVVMPLTLLANWRREMLKFAPSLTFYRHIGAKRVRRPTGFGDVDVVMTTYETVISDIGLLSMIDWNLLLTDEAQAYKNPETQRARALGKLKRRIAIAITGTPLENRTLDLWSIASVAEPGFLGDRRHFESVLEGNPQLLRAAVRPLMLRREVAGVAQDLPERIDIDVPLEMFGPEAVEYARIVEAIRGDHKPALALITRLRQFTTHPSLVGAATGQNALDSSAKLTRLLEIVEEIHLSDAKVIVFVAFTAGSDLIAHNLAGRFGMPVWVMDGRTRHDRRQELIDAFSSHSGSAALVMNPAVGGVGLNITAASHVVHYSLEWNPAKEDQATARAWRRGQDLPVTVHRLYYLATIDEAIVERASAKRELFDDVIQPIGPEDSAELTALLASALRRGQAKGEIHGYPRN